MRGNPPQRVRYQAAKLRRAAALEVVANGGTVAEACAAAGWTSNNSFDRARRLNPDWAKEVDTARARWKAEHPKPVEALYKTDELGRVIRPSDTDRRRRNKQALKKKVRELAELDLNPPDPQPTETEFQWFVRRYFPDRDPHKPQQLKIVEALDTLEARSITLLNIWPEAGKTSSIEDYICKKLAQDPNHRFRVVSEAQDLSKRIVQACARRFTEPTYFEDFHKDYGPFYEAGQERHGKPWTTDQFTVWRNSGEQRDRSLVASSWSSAVYGSRIDTLIVDDVQSQKNYNQAEDIFNMIRSTFFNRGLEMRTLIVGTRIGPNDFYERMIDAGLVTTLLTIPAAGPCRFNGQDVPAGEPTVPSFWADAAKRMRHTGGVCCKGFRTCPRNNAKLTPREYMELLRHQSGENTWASAYMQNPSSNERTTFSMYLERCLDHDRTIGQLQGAA